MKPKPDIEIFTDLPQREKRPEGPFMSLGGPKSIIYFDKLASRLFREHGISHVKFGVDWNVPAAVIVPGKPEERGALRLAGGVSQSGPGTFQIGADGLEFFKRYHAKSQEKTRHILAWRDDIKGFQFSLPQIHAAANQRAGAAKKKRKAV
jgi:hypothetical protein